MAAAQDAAFRVVQCGIRVVVFDLDLTAVAARTATEGCSGPCEIFGTGLGCQYCTRTVEYLKALTTIVVPDENELRMLERGSVFSLYRPNGYPRAHPWDSYHRIVGNGKAPMPLCDWYL